MLTVDNIQYLVVHCSDSPDDENLSAIDIHALHLSFGWHGCGYHRVICRDGSIEQGRPEYWQGAHVYGYNDRSLGVCLIGRQQFTRPQFDALEQVLRQWREQYPTARIVGHRDFAETEKTCPNFDVSTWCKERSITAEQS